PEHYIAYVGGYQKHKNVETLLTAWALARRPAPERVPPPVPAARVPSHGPNGLLCDRLPLMQNLPPAVGSPITSGFIADEDLPGFYRGATLFATASKSEGFGYPVAEALASGAPVICADNSAMKEIVPSAHHTFNPDQPGELALKIEQALAQPDAYR